MKSASAGTWRWYLSYVPNLVQPPDKNRLGWHDLHSLRVLSPFQEASPLKQTIKTHFYFTIMVWSLLAQVHEDGYFLTYLIYQPPDKKTAWADMIYIR